MGVNLNLLINSVFFVIKIMWKKDVIYFGKNKI
jgi:hypothetical protein